MTIPLLCLNMIVKNESHIIINTLSLLTNIFKFSYWVISDTGSTDNTKELIIDFFEKLQIKGDLTEDKWVDFGYNRSLALAEAYNKTDYVLIFDADDSIVGNLILPHLDKDMYYLKFGKNTTYKRPLLINNRRLWKFTGVLHEYLQLINTNESKTEDIIQGDYYIDSGKTGARSMDVDKYIKDAMILEKAYVVEDNIYIKERYAFYCAQSYMDANNYEKSIEWYKKVVNGGNWAQEKYCACIRLGNMLLHANNILETLKYYSKAGEFDSERIEHVMSLMEYYYKNGMHYFVNALYTKHKNYRDILRNMKSSDRLFMSYNPCNYNIENFNSISAYYVNDFESAYICCKIILNAEDCPSKYKICAVSNLIHYKSKAINDTEENCRELFINYNKITEIKNYKDYREIWNILYNKINFTKYIHYNFQNNIKPKILLTITTGKRYDLFEKTINSILNQWSDFDKIDYWFLVDDNSSNEDRQKMQEKYPFFDFYLKTFEEKGHRQSMNICWNKINELNPDYWIHMEDDFIFYDKMNYIEKSIEGLNLLKNENVKQILFNKGYAETINEVDIKGYDERGEDFAVHVYSPSITYNYKNCAYWPHYSFRPSLIDAKTILNIGNFDSINVFFEKDYADKWTTMGFKSGFLNKITCKHIGRLTSERNNDAIPNAYKLNDESQFTIKNNDNNILDINNMNIIKVINLTRRIDRKDKMIQQFNTKGITKYEFIEAVDKDTIDQSTKFLSLFYHNDYGNRKGFIACALSHYNLWKQLLEDKNTNYYLILEDDVILSDNFLKHINNNITEMSDKPILFFGYLMSLYNRTKSKDIYNITDIHDTITINKLNQNICIGGTFCYSINKTGAYNMIKFIHENGIRHGIDYIMIKYMNNYCYESQPFIANAEWYENTNKNIDTDIQKDISTIDLHMIFNDVADNFIFIPSKDQINYDLYKIKLNVLDLMKLALANENCVAFNTLGFLKSDIINLTKSAYFKNTDGIYIKKTYYNSNVISKNPECIYIKLLGIGVSQENMASEWLNMCITKNKWNNIILNLTDNNDITDFYIIINFPRSGEYYVPEKSIIFQMEPWVYDSNKKWGVKEWNEWSCPDEKKFLYVSSHKKYLNNVQWHINIPKFFPSYRKDKMASILSQKNYDIGHIKRVNFIKQLELQNENIIDVYGRKNYHNCQNYIDAIRDNKKENVFIEYKYCFSVENNSEYNYATEKIWEPILCECLCFYWGCPNLNDYIDDKAFVYLDLDDIAGSLDIIKKAISENWWEQKIDIIRREKHKIINELGFFPNLKKILDKNQNININI